MNDSIDLGINYAQDTYEGDAYYSYVGVEAGYRTGAFDVEAHVTKQSYIDGDSVYYMVGAQAGYTFSDLGSMPGGVEVFVGFNNQLDDEWAMDNPNYYAGVNVDLWNGLQLNTRAASMSDGEYTYYSLGLTYNFGNGSRFTARDYASSQPGY